MKAAIFVLMKMVEISLFGLILYGPFKLGQYLDPGTHWLVQLGIGSLIIVGFLFGSCVLFVIFAIVWQGITKLIDFNSEFAELVSAEWQKYQVRKRN